MFPILPLHVKDIVETLISPLQFFLSIVQYQLSVFLNNLELACSYLVFFVLKSTFIGAFLATNRTEETPTDAVIPPHSRQHL